MLVHPIFDDLVQLDIAGNSATSELGLKMITLLSRKEANRDSPNP